MSKNRGPRPVRRRATSRGIGLHSYLRVIPVVRPYTGALLITGGLALISVPLGLYFPWALSRILDEAVRSPETALWLAAGVIAVRVVNKVIGTVSGYIEMVTTARIQRDMAVRVAAHLHALELSFHRTHPAGSVYRLNREAANLPETVMTAPVSALGDVLSVCGALLALYVLAPALAVGLLLFGVPTAVLSWRLGELRRKRGRVSWRASGEIWDGLWERYREMHTVQLHTAEPTSLGLLSSGYGRALKVQIETWWMLLPGRLLEWALDHLPDFAAIAYAAVMLGSGALTPGEGAAVVLYAGMVSSPIWNLCNRLENLIGGLDVADRVFGALDLTPKVMDSADARPIARADGHVRFRGVRYAYPPDGTRGLGLRAESADGEDDGAESASAEKSGTGPADDARRWALDGLDVDLVPGTTTALVGRSGAGKSTAAFLLMRFDDPQEGTIELDGAPLPEYKVADLRRQVALVPQDPAIFDGTIADNLRFVRPDASDADIERVLEQANALDFVRARPKGINEKVNEGGSGLSTGERQRLAIARAFLEDAPVLVLDEATAALDAENEHAVQSALRRLAGGRTTLIIAHRLTTVRKADRIIVLDRGRAIEQGTHEELLAADGRYARMWRLYQGEASNEDLEALAAAA